MQNSSFDEIVAKYWQLLRSNPLCDLNKPTISESLYTELMRRVYRFLLPLYRADEMNSEICQEWILDTKNSNEMNYTQFRATLFRIANEWATNFDLEEYVDFLNKIYERITLKKITNESGVVIVSPTIQVEFPIEETKVKEQVNNFEQEQIDQEWLECGSKESENSDFDYEYKEDSETMVTKKYKKIKDKSGQDNEQKNILIKDPIIYTESVIYFQFDHDYKPKESDIIEEVLAEMKDVIPLGYPTEQFMKEIKNDVYETIQTWIQQKKKEKGKAKIYLSDYNQQEMEIPEEADSGLKQVQGETIFESFNVKKINMSTVQFVSRLTDSLYNYLRKLLKEGCIISLRMYSEFPKPGARTKSRHIMSEDPITEINRFGYNPALERRVHYKLIHGHFVNINYLLYHPEYEIAYRSDVNKIETKDHLAVKQPEQQLKEEFFNNVETSFKKVKQIMLSKKFQCIYQDRYNYDIREQKRLWKMLRKFEKRKQDKLLEGTLQQKSIQETFDDRSFIKMTRGPFHALESKEGIREDDFLNCAEWDLIDVARQKAHKILVIGKPRSGKTTICKEIAKKLNIVHICVENWINALQEKIKNYEAPDDLEEGEEPPKFLNDLEEEVDKSLKEGMGPTDQQIIRILKEQILSPQAKTKGYVLDLTFYKREVSWAHTIRQQMLLGQNQDGSCESFSHVIELSCSDEEIHYRANNLRVTQEDGLLFSKWDREERKRNQPKGDEEEEPEYEEGEEPKPVLNELNLIQRSNDTEDQIKEELTYYNTVERTSMEELLIYLYDNQYIKVESADLTPTEITEIICCRIHPDDSLPLRPIAEIIEGGSDFKSLLSEGLEEGQVPRKWSLWQQIDPVALHKGKVVQGLAEYAASYNNNVFVFSTEENQTEFIKEPKIYLQDGSPYLPQSYRILILGTKYSGKQEQAQKLSELYGLKIVDFNKMVSDRVEELLTQEEHIPNNPNGGRIGLSEQEIQEIQDAKPFPAWKFIPWILDHLGYQLMKKPPPPPIAEEEKEEEEEELDEAQIKKREQEAKKKRDEEEKKRKEQELQQKQKEERRKKRQEAIEKGLDLQELGLEESEEEPIIIDDLPITELVLKTDENGQVPFVGGFILLGFPETEEHLQKLKEHQIEFDRIIYLQDTNEEDPGAEIKQRIKEDDDLYDYDWDLENQQRILNLIREQVENADDIIREISCNGQIDEILIRIRNEIDPFYTKIDNPDDNRATADLDEEERRLPKGDFGDYCPVTFVKDNWLIKGNQEHEVTIYGKTYWLAGENEAEQFKFNPVKFLVTKDKRQDIPIQPPPPKIMILGVKGSGVTTQIKMLCDKYKLTDFNLQQEFLEKLKEEKDKRKRQRLLDRGFKPPQPVEEEGEEPPVDPEIEEDPEDFDKEAHEKEVMKSILNSNQGLVIDGTWSDLPEEANVSLTLQDLLFESRRLPEIVIILSCKEKSTFQRMIDENSIKQEYERLMEERDESRKKQRQEDRETKLKELQEDEEKTPEEIEEEMKQWDEDRDTQDEEEDENDPEKPNLEEMIEKYRESLRERREKDEAFIEEFGTSMKEKNVFVIDDIKTDISAEFVQIKILERVKEHFINRKNLIERQLASELKVEEVPFFEKSYIYKPSKFGYNSPICLSNPTKTKNYPVLYRERIYYLSNQNERLEFLKEPSKYTQNVESIPLDIQIKPRAVVIGLPKSGKSEICKTISSLTGAVHLKMTKIIEFFVDNTRDSLQSEELRKLIKFQGKQINDDMLISLLLKRLQYKDCQIRGWIIEDFPKTKHQALTMARRGLIPSNVFYMKSEVVSSFERTKDKVQQRFGAVRTILANRIRYLLNNLPKIVSFYQQHYNNVSEIDTSKSKWFMKDRAMKEIQLNLDARQQFARDYYRMNNEGKDRACKMQNLNMDNSLCKQTLSQFTYYCPVTWKNQKQLVKCNDRFENTLLYKNKFYFFKSAKERDIFYNNPQRFLSSISFIERDNLPYRIPQHKASEIISVEKSLQGYCPSTIIDEERVVEGYPLLLIIYKEKKYIFDSEFKLQRFLQSPFKYCQAELPVKMPPSKDKVSLYSLQQMEESITFMEQSLGQVVTKALREISENRIKYPTLSIKESMLKLFALYLKTENPANTEYMKSKYSEKMKAFIHRSEIPEELYDLALEKENKKKKNEWPEFKENYYNELGYKYDQLLEVIEKEKQDGFVNFMK